MQIKTQYPRFAVLNRISGIRPDEIYQDLPGFIFADWGDDNFTSVHPDRSGICFAQGWSGDPGTWSSLITQVADVDGQKWLFLFFRTKKIIQMKRPEICELLFLKKYLISILLMSIGFSLGAQQNQPANIFFTKLDNGLQVLVLEDPSVPLATVEIAVHNGSFTEDTAYNGLSHLYEHMFFKA